MGNTDTKKIYRWTQSARHYKGDKRAGLFTGGQRSKTIYLGTQRARQYSVGKGSMTI